MVKFNNLYTDYTRQKRTSHKRITETIFLRLPFHTLHSVHYSYKELPIFLRVIRNWHEFEPLSPKQEIPSYALHEMQALYFNIPFPLPLVFFLTFSPSLPLFFLSPLSLYFSLIFSPSLPPFSLFLPLSQPRITVLGILLSTIHLSVKFVSSTLAGKLLSLSAHLAYDSILHRHQSSQP